MDLFEKCRSYTLARAAIAAGIYPYFLTFEGQDGTSVQCGGRDIVMCGSNNYLGLTTDTRVRDAAVAALESYGTSCTGSRFLNGNLALHEELERELAEFLGKEAALVFSTGYQANVGTITALLARDDVVVTDRDCHASIIDACRMSRCSCRRFEHNDPDSLDVALASIPATTGRLVVVDGVYSMEGDVCALPEIQRVCAAHGARLLVDDAHGLGVLADGRGTCAHFGLTDEVDLITVTFSKSLASLGGAVVGDEDVIHYLRHHARSLIFSASMPPASAAAALAALRILRAEPWRARRVVGHGAHIRKGLSRLGFDIGASTTPIVPVLSPDVLSALALWRRLLDEGVYTNPVVPPAASPRLRTSFMATHTVEELDRVIETFAASVDRGSLDHESVLAA